MPTTATFRRLAAIHTVMLAQLLQLRNKFTRHLSGIQASGMLHCSPSSKTSSTTATTHITSLLKMPTLHIREPSQSTTHDTRRESRTRKFEESPPGNGSLPLHPRRHQHTTNRKNTTLRLLTEAVETQTHLLPIRWDPYST